MSEAAKSWDTSDLVRRLCHALDTAQTVLRQLGENGYPDASHPGGGIRPEKIISESALLALAASKVRKHGKVRENLDALTHALIPHARSDRMKLRVCLHPSLALDYGLAHVYLTHVGHPDTGFDQLLRHSMKSHGSNGRERMPHRVLEQQWTLDLLDNSATKHSRLKRFATEASILNQPMDLLNATREDMYAFTHALMYVCRFGILPLHLPRTRESICMEAEAALARCIDEQDYDLSGELLLSWPLSGNTWSTGAAFGFRVLAWVEDAAGFLPTPATRVDQALQLQGRERDDYFLSSAYHAMYVMGLLCATALHTNRAPPKHLPATGVIKGSFDSIFPLFDADSSHRHWKEVLKTATDIEQDALSGFLLHVAIHRAYAKRNFTAMHNLLSQGSRLGLIDTPIASQTAEMMERVAAL